MSGRVQVTGLRELAEFFAKAPDAIRAEAMDVVRETTEAAANEIRPQYPVKTGTLRDRVRTTYPASTVLAGVVLSSAPHSHLYDFGTRQRRTRSGANRGRMPEKAVVVPVAQRYRVRLVEQLKAVIRRFGFVVVE